MRASNNCGPQLSLSLGICTVPHMLWTPQAISAAQSGQSVVPQQFKPSSQAGPVAARLLASPNPSLQKQAQHCTNPTYQETGSQWSTALSYREAALDAPLPLALQLNAMRGLRISAAGGAWCSLARLGQLNIPIVDAGFVQMLSLIVPINLHEMCQEYSLAPGWKYWTNQAGLAKMACANEGQW